MPLTPHEVETLCRSIQSLGAGPQPGIPLANGSDAVEQLLGAVSQQIAVTTRLCEMAEQIADRLLSIETQPAPKTKPAADPNAPKKRRGRPPKGDKAEAANGEAKAELDPFADPPAANDESNFLFGDEPDAKAEADEPAMTEQELKDVLKVYLNKQGAAGTGKLTALLEQFGVKRFNELPPEKYAAVAAKAKEELAQ